MEHSHSSEKLISFVTRTFVWALFFLVLYLLRSFSILVFLTFVFSYIQAHGVNKLNPYLKRRALSVIIVALLFLGILSAMGSYMVPQVVSQAQLFGDNFREYVAKLDREILRLSDSFPFVKQALPEVDPVRSSTGEVTEQVSLSHSVSVAILPHLLGMSSDHAGTFELKDLTELLKNIGKPMLALLSSFFLALLFSFLIVLDLPRLTESVRALQKTRVGFIYEEVAGSLASFGQTLGHALEAQLIIAGINTALTALAIFFFGFHTKLAFLSLVVFLCSFIPVAGVFISSVPICLLVLEGDGGLQGILIVAMVIWGIHLIEAYILNPMIFGDRLHINPVLVLMILTIGGKLFGVWGLLLGVPVCTYVFRDAIRYREH